MACFVVTVAVLSGHSVESALGAPGKCRTSLTAAALALNPMVIFAGVLIGMAAGCAAKPTDLAKGMIAGQVVDSNGKPASGAIVSVLPFGWYAETNAQGRFSIRVDRAFADADLPRMIVLARDTARNLAGVAEMEKGTTSICLALSPAGTVRVRIIDPEGCPIPGAKATIVISPLTPSGWKNAGFAGNRVWADGNGQAIFGTIPSSPLLGYEVLASADGYGGARVACSSLQGVYRTMTLWPANTHVGGIARDALNGPVANATVFIQDDDRRQPYRETITSGDGRFRLDNVCSGKVPVFIVSDTAQWHGSDELEAGRDDNTVYMRRISGVCVPSGEIRSLLGHPLPSMKDVGVTLGQDSAGKRVLMCFGSMYDPPSRGVLRQLSAMKEYFERHQVCIVCVDILATNQEQVRTWAARNSLGLKIGLLPPDIAKDHVRMVRFIEGWGIRNRMPWLILTDRNHIVRQEDCSLALVSEILDNERAEEASTRSSSATSGR